jgi:L-fucose isomerase-like protein
MRIATIGLCDPGYSEDVARVQYAKAVKVLVQTIPDLVDAGLCPDESKSPEAISELKKANAENPFDALFLLQVAWSRPAVLLQALRAFPGIPVVLYAPGSAIENGTIRSIAPLAGATATINILKRHRVPFKFVCSEPNQTIHATAFMPFLRAARAMRLLSGSKLGMVGFGDMALQNMGFDVQELHERLGVEVESIDMLEIQSEMDKLREDDINSFAGELNSRWKFHGKHPSEGAFSKMIRFHIVFDRWLRERKINAASIKCPTGVTKIMGITPCLIGVMVANRIHFVCENDVPGMLTQLILGNLSSQMTAYWEFYEVMDKKILFGCCGFSPESFLSEPVKVRTLEGFMTGMACCSPIKTGEYTIARIGKELNGPYNIYFTRGQADQPPLWYEDSAGLPGHPSVLYNPDLPVDRIFEIVTAQHVAVTPGNWTNELEELAKMADFKVLN